MSVFIDPILCSILDSCLFYFESHRTFRVTIYIQFAEKKFPVLLKLNLLFLPFIYKVKLDLKNIYEKAQCFLSCIIMVKIAIEKEI